MFKNKTILFISLIFILVSCGNAWESTKRGLTGAKKKSSDEFLVKKKDPLILPPDFENLPSPSEGLIDEDESLSLKKKLNTISIDENDNLSEKSTENSILEKIRKQ